MNTLKQQGHIALALSIVAFSGVSAQGTQASQYQINELRDYVDGLASFSQNMSRGRAVYDKLVSHSGMRFTVIPAQTFQWGQAHAGGVILLDISTLQKPTDILAYKFAHEWGHEALGHQPNFYRPQGGQWRFRRSPTQDEDEADEYAGQFLARFGYAIEPVVAYLESLPNTPGDFLHSTGQRRAQLVEDAFNTSRTTGSGRAAASSQACIETVRACSQVGCPCSGLLGGPFFECRQRCVSCLADANAKCERNRNEAAGANDNDTEEIAEEEEDEPRTFIPDADEVIAQLRSARQPSDGLDQKLYDDFVGLVEAAAAGNFDSFKGPPRPRSTTRWDSRLTPRGFSSCTIEITVPVDEPWNQLRCFRRPADDALAYYSSVRRTLLRLVPTSWARDQSPRSFIAQRSEDGGPIFVLNRFDDNRVQLTVTGRH